ncbi:tyrosine-protein phosphatase [Amycolatopsis coloradensis]|uniref:Tyrosine-protein phosphatase n=1 Tax=Amycolatopsis coloradensis TaxID=76021 RepID=A0ACD5BRM4_9PSEU
MSTSRAVTWEGFYNTRDLGGLPTRSGHATRYGAFFRAADLRFVTDEGWSQARQSGGRGPACNGKVPDSAGGLGAIHCHHRRCNHTDRRRPHRGTPRRYRGHRVLAAHQQ